jgi:hypothetical protein
MDHWATEPFGKQDEPLKQVYKITYPTCKIYIGKDSVGSARYFGNTNWKIVNADFSRLPKSVQLDYTVRKQILWESDTASESELSAKEIEMINKFRSNDPKIGILSSRNSGGQIWDS